MTCPAPATGECSRAETAAADVAVAASALAVSTAAFAACGLPAADDCSGRPFSTTAGALVADGSAVFVVVELSVAAVAAGAFPGLGFRVTGAVAATALASVARFVGSALASVAVSITGVVTAALAAAGMTIFAVVVAVAVAVPGTVAGAVVVVAAVVVAVAVVGAVLESVFACADAAACAAPACELAAIAAAAIASGAVEVPEAGGTAGTFVAVVVTGIATATGIGVVAVRPACWTRMVRSAADTSPFADLSVDFVESAFDAAADFAWDDWVDWVAAGAVGPLLLALLT